MILRPPRSTLTDTLFPYTTLFRSLRCHRLAGYAPGDCTVPSALQGPTDRRGKPIDRHVGDTRRWYRSEEHTSELQSLMRISYAVFCLKKKKQHKKQIQTPTHTIETHKRKQNDKK